MDKIKCFISHETDDIDEKVLISLKSSIENRSMNTIKVILDCACFKYGDDLIENENQIIDSEIVLVLFSENYIKKINANENTGVKREYELIKERLKQKKLIIPILYSGKKEDTVPKEFSFKLYADLSSISPKVMETATKKRVLHNDLISSLKKIVKQVVNCAEYFIFDREYRFRNLEEQYNALFIQTSDTATLPRDCIIKIDAYNSIMDQDRYIVIGRKGSGKTTLINYMQKLDPDHYFENYKKIKPIEADSLNLDFIYNRIIKKYTKDFEDMSTANSLEVFWEIYFFIYCVYIIGIEIEKDILDKNDDRFTVFKKAVNILKKKMAIVNEKLEYSNYKNGVFTCAAELLMNHLEGEVLKNANIDTIFTSFTNNLNARTILENVFTKKLFRDFCLATYRCNKKILIALDGFNSQSEDFRMKTKKLIDEDFEEYKLRKKFEILFYRQLMILTTRIKQEPRPEPLYLAFGAIDFCLIIPQDRYDEIKMFDRDNIKRGCCSLSWDAVDLLEMLVKRLEFHYKITTLDDSWTAKEKFNYILSNYFPNIPAQIKVKIDGHNAFIDLYNYILRLSFWRPRDILNNFAVIMKANKIRKPKSSETIQVIIKNLLNNNAKDIVVSEFVDEYKNIYFNLKEFLESFEDKDLIINFEDFCGHISNVPLNSGYNTEIDDTFEKLNLLYRLGVIGLHFPKEEVNRHGHSYHICFIFNEGLQPYDDFIKSKNKQHTNVKIIFNPIFSKYLGLSFNTNELIMDFDWEYLEINHIRKNRIRRI